MRKQLDALTGVRALAAAWVVLLHIALLTPVLLPEVPVVSRFIGGGNLGVDIFFMLSGFIIAYTYLDKLKKPAPGEVKRFLWLRVARIYPVHFVMLMVVLAMLIVTTMLGMPPDDDRRFSVLSFVMNLFMLQAVPPALAWDDPAWSISTEFFAYLAFPLMAPVLAKVRPRKAFGLMAAIIAVGIVALLFIVYTAHEWPYWSGYALMWVRIAVCFTAGALLFVVWRERGPEARAQLAWMLPVGLLGIAVVSLVSPPAEALELPVLAYPFIPMVLVGCASGAGALAHFFSTKPMVWGGKISYSVYLVHFPMLLVIQQVIERLGVTAGSPLAIVLLIATFGLVVAAGAFLYTFVEEPARKFIRRRVEPRATPEPVG